MFAFELLDVSDHQRLLSRVHPRLIGWQPGKQQVDFPADELDQCKQPEAYRDHWQYGTP